MQPFYRLLTELSSRKTISHFTGFLAKSPISKRFIPHFAKTYGINLTEAEKEINEYQSINDFFTRRLKKGLRPVDPSENAIVSPVDAVITGIGEVDEGTILSIKGQLYTILDLLGEQEETERYKHGKYVVLYLSPTDYHRIHSPIGGELVRSRHIPGKVYPVNDFGLKNMKKVLSRNERLISYIRNDETQVAIIKVGALNVSSIRMSDHVTTNTLEKGQELAYFEFGSTVILLFENDAVEFAEGLKEGDRVYMGTVIATIIKEKLLS
jgi:phosphatidylserine decarboxylase